MLKTQQLSRQVAHHPIKEANIAINPAIASPNAT